MLSKGQFNRRWHAVPETLWQEMLWQEMLWLLGEAAKLTNDEGIYAVDSVPVPVCDNIRICRCRLYPCAKKQKKAGKDNSKGKTKDKDKMDDPYRGYCASKKRYYYGLKGHLLVTASGQPVEFVLTPVEFVLTPVEFVLTPVEFVLTPAATGDIVGFRKLDLDLPEKATVVADAAYTDYEYENLLRDQEQVNLLADRKCNSLRPHPAHLSYLCQCYRKRIETTFSTVTEWLGRRLHAVTPQGWERKVFLTVVAYAILF